MSVSTRLRRAINHVVGGNAENQLRTTKAITPVNRRRGSVLATPKQRAVLTDVTNSFKSPPRDLTAKQEPNLAQSEMKKPIATPVRVSARISAAKSIKAKSTPSSNEIAEKEGTNFQSSNQEVEISDSSKAPKTRGKSKSTAQKKDSMMPESENNNSQTLKSAVDYDGQGKSVSTKDTLEGDCLNDADEQESKLPTRRTRGKQASTLLSDKHAKAGGSVQSVKRQETETKAPRSKADSKSKEDQAVEDTPSPERTVHRRKKPLEKETSSPSEVVIPDSSAASKGSAVRKSVRQAKLKAQNQSLSLETAEASNVSQQNQALDKKEPRKTQKTKEKCDPSTGTTKLSSKDKRDVSGPPPKTKLRQTKINALMSSPKFKSPVRSSPKPSPARKRSEVKKVPIYKLEPKPETLQPLKDDIYDFAYDPKDVKPKRKRLAKYVKTVNRRKKPRLEPENLPPIELKLPGEEKLSGTAKVAESSPKSTPFLEEEFPQEAPSALMDQSICGPSIGELPTSTPISKRTPFVDNQASMVCDLFTPIAEVGMELSQRTIESAASAATIDQVPVKSTLRASKQTESKPAPPPLTLDNCFGFDESEEEPVAQPIAVMKSTPVKRPHPPSNAPFRPPVSPVRKVLESKRSRPVVNRPARLEVSRDVVGIHPIASSAPQEKTKQTTLPDFIQQVEKMDRSDEENRTGYCPPTPPRVFTAPPRRSYSKQEMHQVKRIMFKEHIDAEKGDHDSEEENDENEDSNPRKPKKRAMNKKPRKTKQEREADEWAMKMAQHFEDIDKSELVLSD